MNNDPKMQADNPKFMDRREINFVISTVLFLTNFLLMYFICLRAFPDITGIPRVLLVWVGAYAMTWVMSYATRGLARLTLSLILIGVLYLVMWYRP
ncbi:MAG: hypothetical protein NDI77_04480 [Geobacteraceae bacterium]|nr:hypothetical protein [Geobacteraceae bacterium]